MDEEGAGNGSTVQLAATLSKGHNSSHSANEQSLGFDKLDGYERGAWSNASVASYYAAALEGSIARGASKAERL